MEFKVGDTIIGNSTNRYGITKKGWIGTVTKVDPEQGYIYVTGPNLDNHSLPVSPQYFDLVQSVDYKGDNMLCKYFKVGDLVIGNEYANKYGITDEGWVGRITDINEMANAITVFGEFDKEGPFIVEATCFDLYESASVKPDEEFMSMIF